MERWGYRYILMGIIIAVVYGIYMMLLDLSVPMPIKISLILITVGIVITFISLIIKRRKERGEEDDSSKY